MDIDAVDGDEGPEDGKRDRLILPRAQDPRELRTIPRGDKGCVVHQGRSAAETELDGRGG